MSSHIFMKTYVGAACLAGLSCLVSVARAQTPEVFEATASVKTASGVEASAPVSVTIHQFATDADRDALVAAVKKGGTTAARDLLAVRGDAGTIELGARRTAIKYAYSRSMGDNRLITAVTAEPILFVGAGVPESQPKAGYDLGLILFEVGPSAPGHGELAPAAKVRVDEGNAIVTDDYGAEVVRLSNVVKK